MRRQAFPRMHDDDLITCKVLDDEERRRVEGGLGTNITGGGIVFGHRAYVEPGALLAVSLELPGYPSSVMALAKVVDIHPVEAFDRPYELTVEFHWVGWSSPSAQQQIADYLRARLAA